MFGFSFFAVLAGLAVAIVLSGLVGMVLGMAVAADAGAEAPEDPEAFEAQLHAPGLIAQLSVLSLVVSLLSGAVTAWMAPAAPYVNAGIVGAIGALMGIALPAPGFSRPVRLALALATLPVTLAGAGALMWFVSPG